MTTPSCCCGSGSWPKVPSELKSYLLFFALFHSTLSTHYKTVPITLLSSFHTRTHTHTNTHTHTLTHTRTHAHAHTHTHTLVNLQEAGIKLKELVGSETVTFYVSPFVRSKMTYEQIRRSFHDEQVQLCLVQDEVLTQNS